MIDKECTFSDENNKCNCILHCEKDDWDDLKDTNQYKKNVKLFWQNMRNKLGYTYDYLNETCLIESIIFPKYEEPNLNDEDESLNFYDSSWENTQDDRENYISIIGNRILNFKNCKFLKSFDLTEFSSDKNLTFDNCTFEKEIIFHDTYEASLQFTNNCNFKSQSIDLSNKTFNASLFFKECINIGKLNLHGSNINGSSSFKGSTFKEVDFRRTKFKGIVVLNNTTFENDVDLEYTDFSDNVYFKDVIIKGELNLEDTIFKGEVNFLNLKTEVKNRETARIIKHSFDKIGNIIEANKFYTLEMKKQEKELSWSKNFTDKLIFTFHQISSNHSQDWVLTLFWIINITLGITFLQFEIIEENILIYFMSITYISLISIFICGLLISKIDDKYRTVFSIVFTLIFYSIYSFTTNDFGLCYFVNNINPFSVMQGNDSIPIGELFFKIILGYLYYQFIVSVRQNTRRK